MIVEDDTVASVEYADEATLTRVVYPYGLIDISHNRVDEFFYDDMTGRIEPEIYELPPGTMDHQMLHLDPFEITYQYPQVSHEELRRTSEAIPHDIGAHYLQLPDELPERVLQLAEEIVSEEETLYDQARAIERYFSSGDFSYQIEDRKSTRLNSSHVAISYAVFCLKKK